MERIKRKRLSQAPSTSLCLCLNNQPSIQCYGWNSHIPRKGHPPLFCIFPSSLMEKEQSELNIEVLLYLIGKSQERKK